MKQWCAHRDMINFLTQKSWHRMHKNFLIDSPIKFIYFCSGVVGQFAYMHVVDRYVLPLKAARAERIVRRSCIGFHILHAVSMALLSSYMRCKWHHMNVKNFELLREFEFIFKKALSPHNQKPRALHFLHSKAVSHMIFRVRSCSKIFQWHCMHIKNFELLREFEFIIEKAFAP
jgi:hypothetical protein